MANLTPDQIIANHKDECIAAVNSFKKELQKVRTGRASSGILESVQVDYYGSRTPLSKIAQISAPEPRLLVIQPYDVSAMQSIEKAITQAGLGLNPARDGNIVRVAIPALTEQTRKDIVKMINKHSEDFKVSIRNHRRDANDIIKKLEKDSGVSKDESKKFQEKIQKQTDEHIVEIEKLFKVKEAEVMEV